MILAPWLQHLCRRKSASRACSLRSTTCLPSGSRRTLLTSPAWQNGTSCLPQAGVIATEAVPGIDPRWQAAGRCSSPGITGTGISSSVRWSRTGGSGVSVSMPLKAGHLHGRAKLKFRRCGAGPRCPNDPGTSHKRTPFCNDCPSPWWSWWNSKATRGALMHRAADWYPSKRIAP